MEGERTGGHLEGNKGVLPSAGEDSYSRALELEELFFFKIFSASFLPGIDLVTSICIHCMVLKSFFLRILVFRIGCLWLLSAPIKESLGINMLPPTSPFHLSLLSMRGKRIAE